MVCYCKVCISEEIVKISMYSYYNYYTWKALSELTRDVTLSNMYLEKANASMDAWLSRMNTTLTDMAVYNSPDHNSISSSERSSNSYNVNIWGEVQNDSYFSDERKM